MNKVKACRYGQMVYQPHDIYIGRSFELYGEFSEGEVELFRQIVRPGDTVLDIGANIGAHTVPFAHLVGKQGKIVAFEPQRVPYYMLCANTVLNSFQHVWCFQAGVSAAAGTMLVPDLNYEAETNFGGLSLAKEYPGIPSYRVPVMTVDSLQLQQCRLLKIDVEGMEQQVLHGAVETLRQRRPFLYLEDDRPDQSQALRALIEQLGYVAYLHQPRLFNPHNYANNPQNVFSEIVSPNLFCHPREQAPQFDLAPFGMTQVTGQVQLWNTFTA